MIQWSDTCEKPLPPFTFTKQCCFSLQTQLKTWIFPHTARLYRRLVDLSTSPSQSSLSSHHVFPQCEPSHQSGRKKWGQMWSWWHASPIRGAPVLRQVDQRSASNTPSTTPPPVSREALIMTFEIKLTLCCLMIPQEKLRKWKMHRTRTNNPKIYMEPQKTQNCQSNPEEKEQSWRHSPSRLETMLQSYSNRGVGTKTDI